MCVLSLCVVAAQMAVHDQTMMQFEQIFEVVFVQARETQHGVRIVLFE